jgi:outer membrane lipoprotein-sorting protein
VKKTSRQDVVGSGQWTVDSGQWTVNSKQWAVGSRQRTVDSGQWAVDSPRNIKPCFRSGISILVVCCIMLLLTGCPKPPPIAPPIDLSAGITDLTYEEVSEMIDQRTGQFQTLSGEGKVRIQTWEERYRFSEVFVLEKPERFRLETLGAFDQPQVFLTSDEESLSLYSKKHHTYYTGIPSQENLFKLSGINLSVEDTIQVLSGNPPSLSRINSEWGFPVTSEKYYLERISIQDNIVQRIWFDTRIPAIYKIQEYMLTNGILLLDIDFQDYRAEEGAYPVPAYILIDRPFDETRIEIVYKSLLVNQLVDQTLFKFPPPEGATIHFLDDVTAEQLERLAPYKEFRIEKEE